MNEVIPLQASVVWHAVLTQNHNKFNVQNMVDLVHVQLTTEKSCVRKNVKALGCAVVLWIN